MPLSPERKKQIQEIRFGLLDLHKLLIDRQRGIYEETHEAIGSPGEFLGLVLEHEEFAWLRKLSGVIVEMDELLSIRTKLGDAEAEAVIGSARSLLRLREDGDEFQAKYFGAIQDSPDIVIEHCKLERQLNG